MIDYEKDRVESVTQADTAKTLSDKVIELKNLEDEIENAEESLSKLKEKAKYISNILRNETSITSKYKTTNYLDNIIAKHEAIIIFSVAPTETLGNFIFAH